MMTLIVVSSVSFGMFFLCTVSGYPFEPVGSLWAGAVVVREHPGYIPGFSVWMWILRRVLKTLLAAGNIAHSSLPTAVSQQGLSDRLCLVSLLFLLG